MESIQFSLLGAEDISFGRSTFEVTLGDGRVVTLNQLNLDSFSDKLFSTEDAATASIVNMLTLRATSTGTPAAGLGARLTFQSESEDENPSDLIALEGTFDDVSAGSEDSTAWLLTRRSGAALARAWGFSESGGFRLRLRAALTAVRTITMPDITDTLVTRTSEDTLTNKTVTDAILNAGTGAATMLPNGTLTAKLTSIGTTATTNEITLQTYTLPANTLGKNGQCLEIVAWGSFAGNANVKTLRVYFGNNVVVSNDVTTSPNGLAWYFHAWVGRRSATTAIAGGDGKVGAVNQTATRNVISTLDLTADVTISVTGTNGTAVANDIVADVMIVKYLNFTSV